MESAFNLQNIKARLEDNSMNYPLYVSSHTKVHQGTKKHKKNQRVHKTDIFIASHRFNYNHLYLNVFKYVNRL